MTKKSNQLRHYKKEKIGNLCGYEANSRTHSDEQIQKLVESINEFGFTNPLLIDEENTIIAGHARLQAAQKCGMKELPCIVVDGLTDAQKAALVIADNRLALDAGWDEDILRGQFEFLKENDYDLLKTGFEAHEIEDLFPEPENDAFCDDDDCPDVPVEPITKLGDVWLLGGHRLLCGDATSIDAVDRLMDGAKADMVFTDPPYGINEKGDRSKRKGKESFSDGVKYNDFIDDSIQYAIDAYNLCSSLLIETQIWWGANYYCHSLPQSNNWLVWDKRLEDKQRNDSSDCELAWVKSSKNSVRIFRHLWKGLIKGSENGDARVHPTQKPIALAEWCIKEYAPESKIVLDLFGGPGSTLIACEKLGRKCYMMELSEQYCDVIKSRYENYSGKKAVLENKNA